MRAPFWALLAVAASISAGAAAADTAARFTEDGALMRPEGYREWVFLGATVQPRDINFTTAYSPGIKHTYLDRDSFDHWKKTGTFRIGSVIVQERREEERAEFMNAEGYFAGPHVGLQVMVKDPDRFPESIWGFFSFGRPPWPEKVRPIPGLGELDCAGCHTRADRDWVFTRFYPMLDDAAPAPTTKGQALFEREWTPATGVYDDTGDGLGPLFNAKACVACHPAGGRGTFTVDADGRIDGDGLLLRIGLSEYGDPVYGRQVQTRAIPGLRAEGVPAVHFEAVADPSGTVLRRPRFEVRDAAYGGLDPATRIAGRVAPAVIGNGALEQVPDAAIAARADPDDRDGDGISGRVNAVEQAMGGTRIGRYGWKASQWNLLNQTAMALRMDMGLASRLMGPAWGDCTPVQTDCHEAPDGARAAKGGREVAMADVEAIRGHLDSLAPPPRRAAPPAGERLFTTLGCAACHVPSLPRADGGSVAAFTDLLLHDMGGGLADGLDEESATGAEWRTAPLTGLGRLIENDLPLLHDGRARDANEAILWHGGEGAAAAQAWRDLDDGARRDLIDFLRTL